MSRPVACIVLAVLVLCSMKGVNNQIHTPSVQAAEAPPIARKASRGGAIRIDFKVIALREAKAAGIREPRLFVRQMAAESGFLPCAGSPAGAQGIAQIMPDTADSWGVDPFMPVEALREAAKRMAVYERQLGSYTVALAAYNAGPGAVQKYGGVPPYGETREYIRRITTDYPLPGMKATFYRPGRLEPEFSRKLTKLLRATNGKVSIVPGNAFRSVQEQTRLWKEAKRKHGGWRNARRWVAPPFCSNHGRGTAADLRGDLKLAHRLAPRYGLVFPMSHEPWHVELPS